LLSPLKEKLGVMMLQLPASFGPEKLPSWSAPLGIFCKGGWGKGV
jgi:hypothetical protein